MLLYIMLYIMLACLLNAAYHYFKAVCLFNAIYFLPMTFANAFRLYALSLGYCHSLIIQNVIFATYTVLLIS